MAGTAAKGSSEHSVLFKTPCMAGEWCEAYIGTRDHVTKAHAREALEKAWLTYGHLCPEKPEQFIEQLRQDFHARSGELFLLSVFGDAGLNLVRPPPKGPDIKILLPGNRACWIEAVVPTPAKGTTRSSNDLPANGVAASTQRSNCFFGTALPSKISLRNWAATSARESSPVRTSPSLLSAKAP